MTMNSQKHFRCDSCDITYQTSYNLRRHIDQIHSDNPTYPCSKCSKRCGGKNELKRHLQTHDSREYLRSALEVDILHLQPRSGISNLPGGLSFQASSALMDRIGAEAHPYALAIVSSFCRVFDCLQ